MLSLTLYLFLLLSVMHQCVWNFIRNSIYVCVCVCAFVVYIYRITAINSKGAKRSWCDKVYFPYIIYPNFTIVMSVIFFLSLSLSRFVFSSLSSHHISVSPFFNKMYILYTLCSRYSLYCSHWLFKKFKFKWYSICSASIITQCLVK